MACFPWNKKNKNNKKEEKFVHDVQVFDYLSLLKEFDNEIEFVKDLIQSLLKELNPKLEHIRTIIDVKDTLEVNDIAHGMKGATQSLMCPKISKLLHQMQLCKDNIKNKELLEKIESEWIILNKEFDVFLENN